MFVCKDENKRKRDQERNLFTTTQQPCYSYSIYSTKGADFEERIVGPGTSLLSSFQYS